MATNNNILQELRELESSLADHSPSPAYTVPGGYFDTLAAQILLRIKALEATSSHEEALLLAPVFKHVPHQSPYKVPADYFSKNEETLLQTVRGLSQSPEEELASISSLLSGIKKENPYSVPADYFQQISIPAEVETKTETKVIAISSRKWYRYAAAAAVTAIVVISSVLVFTKKQSIDPSEKSFAWVKKNLNKVSTDEITDFIEMTDNTAPVVASATDNSSEIKELMKNVSDKEIQDFLNDANAIESDDPLTDNEIFN